LVRGSFTNWAWNQISSDRLNALVTAHTTLLGNPYPTTSSLRLIRSMDRLRGLLRGLNDKLPLNVTGILPISAAFRDTEVFSPGLCIPSTSAVAAYRRKRKANDEQERAELMIFSPYMWTIFVHVGTRLCILILIPGYGNYQGEYNLTYRDFPTFLPNQRLAVFGLFRIPPLIITLEQSGKWPDELTAFTRMKQLLVIRIHELLSPIGIPSHVTKENMLDIFLDGIVFRVSIAQPRELRLLQQLGEQSKEPDHSLPSATETVQSPVQTPSSLAWIRLNQSMPTIAGLLAGISRSRTNVFPTACRLAKRWLSAHGFPVITCPFEAEFDGVRHLIYDRAYKTKEQNGVAKLVDKRDEQNLLDSGARMTEIAVELLVVYAGGFCDPISADSAVQHPSNRISATGSPVTAFLRFLKLLVSHDWESQPILVDLNEGFSDLTKRRQALASMEGNRTVLPAMVICTPVDPTGTEWTTIGPTRAGLKELQRLALQSRALLRAMLVAGAQIKDLKAVFKPTHNDLNIMITVKSDALHVRAAEAVDFIRPNTWRTDERELNERDSLPDEIPPPGGRFWPSGYCYDPVAYLVHLLRCRLGKYCEVRWDRHGGNWIGLKWRSTVMGKCPFGQHSLDGLVTHEESETEMPQMVLTHSLQSIADLLTCWAPSFIESVQIIAHRTPSSKCLETGVNPTNDVHRHTLCVTALQTNQFTKDNQICLSMLWREHLALNMTLAQFLISGYFEKDLFSYCANRLMDYSCTYWLDPSLDRITDTVDVYRVKSNGITGHIVYTDVTRRHKCSNPVMVRRKLVNFVDLRTPYTVAAFLMFQELVRLTPIVVPFTVYKTVNLAIAAMLSELLAMRTYRSFVGKCMLLAMLWNIGSSGALIDCWSVRRAWQLDCKRFIANRGDIVSDRAIYPVDSLFGSESDPSGFQTLNSVTRIQ
ncbi:U3 small nucleolar RNA-associated protein 22, partial [Clonorchis sinensis]